MTARSRGAGGGRGIVRIAGEIVIERPIDEVFELSTHLAAMDIHGTLVFEPVARGTRMR
jgi:hypothetical protein